MNEISTRQAALWKLADRMGAMAELRSMERNADKAVRVKFSADKAIIGSRAWALDKIASLSVQNYDDATCDAIESALK